MDNQVEVGNRALINLKTRLRLMNRYPDVLQVLTVSQPLEKFVKPTDAARSLSFRSFHWS